MGLADLWRALCSLARIAAPVTALALIAALVAGCSTTSTVSNWTDFDANSKTAIILMGTSVAGYVDTTNDKKSLEPLVFVTHWQPYDPKTLRLLRGDSLIFSERIDSVFVGEDEFNQWEMSATEIPPGSYALTATFIHRTITTFMPLTGKNADIDRSLSGMSINIDAPVDPAKHFLFEVKPGQVVYLGHFEFLSAPQSSDRIAGVNYTHDEAAARAALKDYPGITGEMVTLDLALPTETAVR